ncbi:hypothetical protein WJX77_009544 [Trebouxia sp. C0004]
MPMRVVVTANALVWNFLCMPHVPQDNATMKQAWEQEFAWTEAEKPVKMAAKALMVGGSQNLSQQSIFCFETLTHMLYWSSIVYDYKRVWEQEFAWIEVDKPVIASMSISWSDLQLISARQDASVEVKVYVTRHSPGGALATLAAYDISKSFKSLRKAPWRVPDTWSIINDQDVATRGGEFVFLYKRPGHRVIANNAGHMMVKAWSSTSCQATSMPFCRSSWPSSFQGAALMACESLFPPEGGTAEPRIQAATLSWEWQTPPMEDNIQYFLASCGLRPFQSPVATPGCSRFRCCLVTEPC